MQSEHAPVDRRPLLVRGVRHHLVLVVLCLGLGGLFGWLYAAGVSTAYTSTTRVLVNPSTGNPFAPTPASVREDEQTSLETEAQVVRSAEVLDRVAEDLAPLTTAKLESGLSVVVPPNTQILEISYTASDPAVAQEVAQAVGLTYLDNRQRRFEDVTSARIDRVQTQTLMVVADLRTATAAAQTGRPAERSFQGQLADALRNELVSLRAQRTALENGESPPGAVISPASAPVVQGALLTTALPLAGAVAGLALGCLLAMALERLGDRVRSAGDVEAAGLPVIAAMPPARRMSLRGRTSRMRYEATIRRLRARVLEGRPRPDVMAVAPAGVGPAETTVSEALATSLAKAGHRVVLVRTDGERVAPGLAVQDDGLAEALLHERLSVLDLLHPSVEPLLSLLPAGRFSSQTTELLTSDRLRSVLEPLVEAGHLVVIGSPGVDSVDGEAVMGAADLGLVVVTTGGTRQREVAAVSTRSWRHGVVLAGVVLERHRHLGKPLTAHGPGRRLPGRGAKDSLAAHDVAQETSSLPR